MSSIEVVATISGLACVALTIRQNIWCWPTGIVMVLLYSVIFYQARLYSDMGLQVVYVGLQVYGWCQWLRGGPNHATLTVTPIGLLPAIAWASCASLSIVALGWTMHTYTDASLPYWDATTTVLSLVAQYLMARKILESWLVWIAVDVLATGIYLVKGLHLTASLYTVFLFLAVLGFFAWKRSMQNGPAPTPVVD